MKMLNRIVCSIKRRPYQMVLMFLVVFILGNVLFASIAIKQTSESVKTEIRRRIPAKISLITDKTLGSNTDPLDYLSMKDLIKDLEKEKSIKKISTIEYMHLNKKNMYSSMLEERKENYTYLYSFEEINETIQNLKIIEGRNYTEDDLTSDHPKIVLNNKMIEQVGETFKLNVYDYLLHGYKDEQGVTQIFEEIVPNGCIEFEIIGKFDSEDLWKKTHSFASNGVLFIPRKWADEFTKLKQEIQAAHPKDENINGTVISDYAEKYFDFIPIIHTINLDIEGMDAVERLEKEIKENDHYLGSKYALQSSTADYLYIQAPLENLTALADVAMIASFVLTIILLSLISMLYMRMRKREIGILMALGERKHKVLGQFVCELVLVGLLAATCAIYSGNKMGSMISNEFIKIQIDTDSEMQYQEEGEYTQLDMANNYEVKLDSQYIVSIYGITCLILLISSGAPVIFILKMKPKEVLM